MPQDSRTQANRRRKATEKLAKWKETNTAAPAKGKRAAKGAKKA